MEDLKKPMICIENSGLENSGETPIKKLVFVSFLCTVFIVIELVGGILANSLAIMTDAAHLLSDLCGFAISIVAIYISRRPSSQTMSYGYLRAEIIGALLSLSIIWALTVWLLYEAILRLIHPEELDSLYMLITATIGIVINIIMAFSLHSHTHSHGHSHDHSHSHSHSHDHSHGHSHDQKNKSDQENHSDHHCHDDHQNVHDEHVKKEENINIKAALIHIIGDFLQSIGVLIAAIIIYFFNGPPEIDPCCTILFAVIVIFTTIPIAKDCLHILMENAPLDINLEEMSTDLLEVSLN